MTQTGLTPYFYSSNSDMLAGFKELIDGSTRYTKAGNVFARDLGDIAMMVLNTLPEAKKLVGGHLENRGIRRPIVDFINDMRAMKTSDRLLIRYASSWTTAAIWAVHNLALTAWDMATGRPRTMYTLANLVQSMNILKDPMPAITFAVNIAKLIFFRNPFANLTRVALDYVNAYIFGIGFSLRELFHQAALFVVNYLRSFVGLPPIAPRLSGDTGQHLLPNTWKKLLTPVVGNRVVNHL